MSIRVKLLIVVAPAALFACAESPGSQPVNTNLEPEKIVAERIDRESAEDQRANGGRDEAGEIANLPFARGETFRTLDAYLAHLETGGAVGLPWWREVRPGFYEQVTTMRGKDSETATREDLMRRFGFDR